MGRAREARKIETETLPTNPSPEQTPAKSYRGTLQSVSDDGITIRTVSDEQTFLRANVLRVSIKGKGHRLRNTVIGAGIGRAQALLSARRSAANGTAIAR
jgi:hypothetical protein